MSILEEIKLFDDQYLLSNNNIFNQRTNKDVKYWKIVTGGTIFIIPILITIFRKISFGKKCNK